LAPVDAEHAAWPRELEPALRNVDVGIAGTWPELDRRREVREVEALNLAAIAAARQTIYVENQYLAARRLVDALAARLSEDDGPEIVIVLPRRGNNRLERETMDGARHRLIQLLWAADDHRRLGVYWPVTDGGAPIYVHSKLLVVDDRLLRVGSSNLNNGRWGLTASAMSPSRWTRTVRNTMTSAGTSSLCVINWCRNTSACPSATLKRRWFNVGLS